jgi:phosphoribosyl-ATP pyrophosphohydrolase
MNRFAQLDRLAADIAIKAQASPDESYTAQLISRGVSQCAKKFGEESVELVLASVAHNTKDTTAEAADVLYHFFVLLQAANVSAEDVMAELKRREGVGGLVEKATRNHE